MNIELFENILLSKVIGDIGRRFPATPIFSKIECKPYF
jgi:hypothetical protein